VINSLLRLLAEFGPVAGGTVLLIAVVVASFVLYVGVAMTATLASRDQSRARLRYKVFRDLLELFHLPGQKR
jgi:hypothetical protein